MMLQIASGIRSSGKPTIDIGQGPFRQAADISIFARSSRRKSILSH
jgi:hypothetical protein